MSGETTAGKRFALLPRSYSFSMSGTFGDVELESEVILEDNITLNRIMAEPQGTARHLVARTGSTPRVSLWQTLRENLGIATAAVTTAAASEEVAHLDKNTVSQRQTCLNSDGVDRDITTSRVMPWDGFSCCGTPPQAGGPPTSIPIDPTNEFTQGNRDTCNLLTESVRIDDPASHTAVGDSNSQYRSDSDGPIAGRQTTSELDGDNHQGLSYKNLNQEQVVECKTTPISMDQFIEYFVTTPVSMMLPDPRSRFDSRMLRPADDFDRDHFHTKARQDHGEWHPGVTQGG